MKEEQAVEKLEDDIKELALICVTAMRRKRIKKPEAETTEESSEFSMLLQRPDKTFANSQEHHLLNTNQTVKGIKKIEMQQRIQRPLSL